MFLIVIVVSYMMMNLQNIKNFLKNIWRNVKKKLQNNFLKKILLMTTIRMMMILITKQKQKMI